MAGRGGRGGEGTGRADRGQGPDQEAGDGELLESARGDGEDRRTEEAAGEHDPPQPRQPAGRVPVEQVERRGGGAATMTASAMRAR